MCEFALVAVIEAKGENVFHKRIKLCLKRTSVFMSIGTDPFLLLAYRGEHGHWSRGGRGYSWLM